MIIPDLNLLIYSVNEQSSFHKKAKEWWEGCLNSNETVSLPWVVLLGFLRITTSPRVFSSPLSPVEAWDIMDSWIENSVTYIINPGSNHFQILKTLVLDSGTGGNLTTDAHLAALCIENNGVLYTADNDFKRFPSLKWVNPIKD
ncbi:MAG: type II toxin-antitoxin system VapC family toxin [Spirochaetia bacterium]|jgi:toxin-antitoxin system PIN domain toxin|nr:type II toxin-antitoxin system VapC family toxin [Spirochaetia bacterium]